ncbi:hypothetical protein ABFS83_07G055300 [Erythranthe nasuta]
MASSSVATIRRMNHTSNPSSSTATATATALLVPKIEPKIEPLDEPFPAPPGFNFPTTSSAAAATSSASAAPTPTATATATIPEVRSDYNRLTELFFSSGLPNLGDVAILPESDPNPQAIVTVPEPEEAQPSNGILARHVPRRYYNRSSELVRVMDLQPDDRRFFRDEARRTRMLFDSLRVYAVAEDERRRGTLSPHRRTRGDLKASTLMRERGLWLNRDKRVVGEIPGVSIGDVFFFRIELCVLGLHGQAQAGIDFLPSTRSSNGDPVATSVIVSGGYEDDEDSGDVIIYTGHGGQDRHSRQVVHQKLEQGNLAMERSMHYHVEVRVIRGLKYEGSITGKVYVYDGLYRVTETWFDVGRSGFGVFKFKLVRIDNQPEMGSTTMKFALSLKTRPLEARPRGYVSLDISHRRENLPVFLFNDIDEAHDPIYYEYSTTTIFPQYLFSSGSSGSGCDCIGGCNDDDCFCARKNGGEFAYDLNGILVRGKPLVFECGPHCRCPPTCRNRVTQKGIKNRFEVFRSRETGWGVRTLDLIQAGSFICEYAGIVLTREQAELVTMNGDNLVYPSRFSENWKEWGDLSKVSAEYSCPTYPSVPPLDFAVDVSRMRNLACYMSHSSNPNVFVQLVLYDHNNVSFPHLMLFAMETIPPLREISVDYGVANELTEKLTICN